MSHHPAAGAGAGAGWLIGCCGGWVRAVQCSDARCLVLVALQYKKKTPLLRLYKTLVGRTSTWVIGAEDEALYYTHSDAVDPPVSGWQAASQAAQVLWAHDTTSACAARGPALNASLWCQPPPSLHLVWSEEGQSGGLPARAGPL
jgi:hypothetical protein